MRRLIREASADTTWQGGLEMTESFPFESRAISALVRAIENGYTTAEAGTRFLEANVDRWAPAEYPNKATRLQQLFQAMRADDDHAAARKGALELATIVLRENGPSSPFGRMASWWEGLRAALAADGWEWHEEGERLVPTIVGVDVGQETIGLETDLRDLGWRTAAGHYRQAVDAFARGDWSSSNAQLRSLVEELIPLIAEAESQRKSRTVRAAIDVLREDLLVEGEFDLLKGLWQMLQHRGPHPGLSDEEEARYRLMIVTAQGRFLLARLEE